MAAMPETITVRIDTSPLETALDTLLAKLAEARALLIEIDALLNGDADGANPPPPMDTPA
jgi:hypothetical protein